MRCSPHLEMEAGTNDVTELSGTDRQTFSTVAQVANKHCRVDGISNPRHIHPFTHTSRHFRGISCWLGEQNNSSRIQLSSAAARTPQDSHDKGLVPYRVQSLLLYFGLEDFVIGGSILHNKFGGFGSGATCSALLLVLQDGQQAVWITETWNTKLHG